MVLELESFVFPPPEDDPDERTVTPRRARTIIRREINKVIKPKSKVGMPHVNLFRITAEPMGEITPSEIDVPLLDRNRLQDVGLNVMKEFGLAEDKFVDEGTWSTLTDEKDTVRLSTDRRTYPSLTIRGLLFKRRVTYAEDGRPTEVNWSVDNESDVSWSSWNTSASWEEILETKLGAPNQKS